MIEAIFVAFIQNGMPLNNKSETLTLTNIVLKCSSNIFGIKLPSGRSCVGSMRSIICIAAWLKINEFHMLKLRLVHELEIRWECPSIWWTIIDKIWRLTFNKIFITTRLSFSVNGADSCASNRYVCIVRYVMALRSADMSVTFLWRYNLNTIGAIQQWPFIQYGLIFFSIDSDLPFSLTCKQTVQSLEHLARRHSQFLVDSSHWIRTLWSRMVSECPPIDQIVRFPRQSPYSDRSNSKKSQKPVEISIEIYLNRSRLELTRRTFMSINMGNISQPSNALKTTAAKPKPIANRVLDMPLHRNNFILHLSC